MTKHVSVDIETLGTAPGSAVIALGAVVFDPKTGETWNAFYASFNATALFYGFTTDPETIAWWEKQSDDAKRMLSVNNISIDKGLDEFYEWWKAVEGPNPDPKDPVRFWAKPPSFDEVLLGAAYQRVGIKRPWSYRAPRCVRTILDTAGMTERAMEGIPHYALDDAIHQALVVSDAYRELYR